MTTDKNEDERQRDCTYYINAGSSPAHKNFLWHITSDRKIFAHSPENFGLGAHRYFAKDKAGKTGTNLISTNIKNHENFWKFE